MNTVKSLLRGLLTGLLAVVLLFEEWGWEPLARLIGYLARWPLWARLEATIRRLPPWGALLVFALPVIVLFPVKLLALYLFGSGQKLLGLFLLLAAKLVGTAAVARLFQLTEPSLMQFAWFATWYPRWKAWKDRLMALVRASAFWQRMVAVRQRIRLRIRAWWRA